MASQRSRLRFIRALDAETPGDARRATTSEKALAALSVPLRPVGRVSDSARIPSDVRAALSIEAQRYQANGKMLVWHTGWAANYRQYAKTDKVDGTV